MIEETAFLFQSANVRCGDCGEVVPASGLRQHSNTVCPGAFISCTIRGCNALVARSSLELHMREQAQAHVKILQEVRGSTARLTALPELAACVWVYPAAGPEWRREQARSSAGSTRGP